MNRFAAHYARQRRITAQKADDLAEMVSQGYSISAAGRHLGMSQQSASKIWQAIKAALGPQAYS